MKKSLIILLLFFSYSVMHVHAHTGLHKANPTDGEVVTEPLKQLSLTFETNIENGSTFELKNAADETVPSLQITINENELLGEFENLPNDQYSVLWKIIGADGHIVEGKYGFTLQAPDVTVEKPAEEAVDDAQEEQDQNDEAPVNEKSSEDNAAETKPVSETNNQLGKLYFGLGIATVALVLAGIWFRSKRRR